MGWSEEKKATEDWLTVNSRDFVFWFLVLFQQFHVVQIGLEHAM